MNNKKCFVIMGYGVRTDYTTGREIDLDKTYKNIIKPAAKAAGLECIRADEIINSGTIDVPMYQNLIESEVVIADLSTNNSNAFYELGVRHALKPKTTIAIAENNFIPPFDINHILIHKYEHLGKDIGYDEVNRFREELINTIETVLSNENIDSPVYTNISDLIPPSIRKKERPVEVKSDNGSNYMLSELIEKAIKKMDFDKFEEAKSILQEANKLDTNNEYIIQKLALATYKSELPNKKEALHEALDIMSSLNIEQTTNPESLGIVGAIYKRLWEESGNESHLTSSIEAYEKGFYIKNDYYNGINLAYLYNVRAFNQKNRSSRITDFVTANRIRERVIKICNDLYESSDFNERSDKYWILATLEEGYFAINSLENYEYFKREAIKIANDNWKRNSTETQITKLDNLIKGTNLEEI